MKKRVTRPSAPPSGSRPSSSRPPPSGESPRHGLARALSRRGYCSRSQAEALVRAGRVELNERVVHDPETPTLPQDRIRVDGVAVAAAEAVWILLNKPRGYVTTARDERGRDTVYALIDDAALPWLAPIGRLDKASEGLLLFCNDSAAAARLTAPESHVAKTYHVQVDCLPDDALLARLRAGIEDRGERLAARSVALLRRGEKNAWLEIVLDEGRNRHIRRLLDAHGIAVLRLIRVAIGGLALGDLAKGQWRRLDAAEIAALTAAAG
ncbi:MAG: pseudouridine synthase [Lysobacterales bacterium 69-70]|nr:rRNA pseudouridine synthase [Xanthomonadaceae bacterium]ODU36126.1 MAG: pseudouridine synthase [Xanthomonadaceae bacterium SCN 69-320]ODV18279.1 MAG: pseudouridine synthase [Xanthomonadaceae bacterium SCN 69-25]OJY99577.1 MAG: pseudouridine synthase [Xanthomonadales bacterium 69-70]